MQRNRRSSILSIGSNASSTSSSQRRRSSVPSLNLLPAGPGVQGRPFLTQRRRGSQQQQQQPQQLDSLKSISESGKPTLELAAYASEEFVNAMREAVAARFTVVPSRQMPPHLRRMSEPVVGPGGRLRSLSLTSERRHSVHALVDGPPVAFLSKKTQFGSGDSGHLSSFAELDEAQEADEEAADAASAAVTARETARSLWRSPTSPSAAGLQSSATTIGSTTNVGRGSLRSQQRKVSIDSAVYFH